MIEQRSLGRQMLRLGTGYHGLVFSVTIAMSVTVTSPEFMASTVVMVCRRLLQLRPCWLVQGIDKVEPGCAATELFDSELAISVLAITITSGQQGVFLGLLGQCVLLTH